MVPPFRPRKTRSWSLHTDSGRGRLLGELGVSHGVLRTRFESFLGTVSSANQNRSFRELAGASFVLGAAARIVEAAEPPIRNVRPGVTPTAQGAGKS